MSYTLDHLSIQGCLRIRVEGTWPYEKQEHIMGDILALWEANNKPPVYIDIRSMEDTPSILGDYEVAERLSEFGFWRMGRIAVLDSPSRRSANDFFETTTYNRGLCFRFFYDNEQEAVDWLIAGRDDGHG